MKKTYEAPEIQVEEYRITDLLGAFDPLSGWSPILPPTRK